MVSRGALRRHRDLPREFNNVFEYFLHVCLHLGSIRVFVRFRPQPICRLYLYTYTMLGTRRQCYVCPRTVPTHLYRSQCKRIERKTCCKLWTEYRPRSERTVLLGFGPGNMLDYAMEIAEEFIKNNNENGIQEDSEDHWLPTSWQPTQLGSPIKYQYYNWYTPQPVEYHFFTFSTEEEARTDRPMKDICFDIRIDAECSDQDKVVDPSHCGEHMLTLMAAYRCK